MTELQQFCLLAQSQKGRACAALIEQVINHKRIYQFGELLEIPSVQALEESEFSKVYFTLELFSYGVYLDYTGNPSKFLDLSPNQLNKLRHLTILSLVQSRKTVSYDVLLKSLYLTSTRELEDMVMEVVMAGLMEVKIDQKNSSLHIISSIARDYPSKGIASLIQRLQSWKENCHNINDSLQSTLSDVSTLRARDLAEANFLQAAVEEKKTTVKAAIEAGQDVSELLKANK